MKKEGEKMRKKKKESKTVVSVEQIMTIKCHVMNAGNFSQSSGQMLMTFIHLRNLANVSGHA